jgi:hypothetical protein
MALYGVYGSHTVEACPVNNLANAKKVIAFVESDLRPLLSKYRINNVLGQYHSAFEHTFLWIFDAEDPHLIEGLILEAGFASFNSLRIVPLRSLKEGVIPLIKKVHGL